MTRLSCHRKEQGNISALVQIFDAIPSPIFSVAVELRVNTPNLCSITNVNPDLSPFCIVVLNTSSPSDSQTVSQLIKWEIFNKNIPFYGNIGVYLTGFALDSSVFWPFYPILLSDSELQHSLSVRFPLRSVREG